MNIRKHRWKTGRGWMLDVRLDGQRIRKLYPTRHQAERAYQKLIQGTDLAPARLPEIEFGDFLKIYAEKKPWRTDSYKQRTLQSLELPCHIRSLHSFRREDIERIRDQRLVTCAPSTVRQDLAAIHDCFKWAVKLGYVRQNPAENVERPVLPVKQDDPQPYIERDDFYGKLLPIAGKDTQLWEFMAWTGLRISEALALEWADVNLKEGYVVVRRGKGRKQRLVPLLPAARVALNRTPRSTVGGRKVFWYASDRHACLRRLQRRCKAVGIDASRLHDLRHTFGSWAAQAGVDLEVIAACMGHTSTTVTKLYAHLSPGYKRRELEKMTAGKPEANALAKAAET